MEIKDYGYVSGAKPSYLGLVFNFIGFGGFSA